MARCALPLAQRGEAPHPAPLPAMQERGEGEVDEESWALRTEDHLAALVGTEQVAEAGVHLGQDDAVERIRQVVEWIGHLALERAAEERERHGERVAAVVDDGAEWPDRQAVREAGAEVAAVE